MHLNYVGCGEHFVTVSPKTQIWGVSVGDSKNICDEIKKDIERHIDNVQSVYIEQEMIYEFDGQGYKSIYDAMSDIFKYDIGWTLRGKRKGESIFSSSRADTFKELIENAYQYPYDFEFSPNNLPDREMEFLRDVLEWRKSGE